MCCAFFEMALPPNQSTTQLNTMADAVKDDATLCWNDIEALMMHSYRLKVKIESLTIELQMTTILHSLSINWPFFSIQIDTTALYIFSRPSTTNFHSFCNVSVKCIELATMTVITYESCSILFPSFSFYIDAVLVSQFVSMSSMYILYVTTYERKH